MQDTRGSNDGWWKDPHPTLRDPTTAFTLTPVWNTTFQRYDRVADFGNVQCKLPMRTVQANIWGRMSGIFHKLHPSWDCWEAEAVDQGVCALCSQLSCCWVHPFHKHFVCLIFQFLWQPGWPENLSGHLLVFPMVVLLPPNVYPEFHILWIELCLPKIHRLQH